MHLNYKQTVIWDLTLIDVGFLGSEQSVPSAIRGLAHIGVKITTGAPNAVVGQWAPSATIYNSIDGNFYLMTGTPAAPVWSLVESSNLTASTFGYNTNATAGAYTIPAAQMVNAMLDRNGGTTNRADVTDTATAIIALLPGAIVGSTFEFVLRNISATPGQQVDLQAGVGVTISGTNSIFAGGDITYIGIVTNVGTPAVTLYAEADTSALLPSNDVGSSVNTIQLTAAATGVAPIMAAVGLDAAVGHVIDAKAAGQVEIAKNSTGGSTLNRGSLKALIVGQTLTALGTVQNSTPTAAQLLGGLITQTSVTGAGTVTLPTGTLLSSALLGAQVGDSFEVMFANLGGGFALTVTAGASGTTVIGTAAIPSAKTAKLTFVNTATNTWSVFMNVSA